MTEPPDRDWIGRVKEADREAEEAWKNTEKIAAREADYAWTQALSLIAIAAELRAQRIARRPGAGQ